MIVMHLIFEISYNGTDWEKLPEELYCFDSNGKIIANTVFIDRDHVPYYLRVVIDETPIEREVP